MEQLLLETSGLNGKFSAMEQQLTRARDQLEVLHQEEERLSAIWQGRAKEAWNGEFLQVFGELTEAVSRSRKSLAGLKRQAELLIKEEQKVQKLVEGL